jgi:hypothetical protein
MRWSEERETSAPFERQNSKGSAIRQKLIDLYLLDCAKRGKKLRMKWVS